MKDYTNILEECIKVAKSRQEQYGEATKSLELCSNILKDVFNIKLNVSEICKVLVALKLSRQSHLHKDDNFIDVINYLAIALHSKNAKNDKK